MFYRVLEAQAKSETTKVRVRTQYCNGSLSHLELCSWTHLLRVKDDTMCQLWYRSTSKLSPCVVRLLLIHLHWRWKWMAPKTCVILQIKQQLLSVYDYVSETSVFLVWTELTI